MTSCDLAAPYFNAGLEVFCRDWTGARLDFAIMDYRDRGELALPMLTVVII
jgi:hypothetical protein